MFDDEFEEWGKKPMTMADRFLGAAVIAAFAAAVIYYPW